MKFLFASDSFKREFIFAKRQQNFWQKAAREIFPDCQCDSIVVADGGEGTTAAVLCGYKWKKITCASSWNISGRILQVIMACWMKIVQ